MASYVWANASSGSWTDGAEWLQTAAPGGSDNALINVAGSYTVTIDAVSIGSLTMDDKGATLVGGVGNLFVSGTISLQSGTFVLTQTLVGGSLMTQPGTVAYNNGTLDGVTINGSLYITADGSSLFIENGIRYGGTGQEHVTYTAPNGNLTFLDSEILNNLSLTIGATSGGYSNLTEAATMLTFGTTTAIAVVGYTLLHGGFDNQGTVFANSGFIAEYGGSFYNQGWIGIGDFQAGNDFDNLYNTGTVDISGAGTQLTLGGSITNIGSLSIGGGGELIVNAASALMGQVVFADRNGTLVLSAATGETDATLIGFDAGDEIILRGSGLSLNHTGSDLNISRDGIVIDHFTLLGQNESNANFSLVTQAGAGSAILTNDAPCYCAGTHILTDQGERRVEMLQPGDLVMTRWNRTDAPKPVRWVGYREVTIRQDCYTETAVPIRIVRNAIALGMPHRDLLVSPDHAVLVEGRLIQARQLVNNTTIVRESFKRSVTYFHIELDQHAILVAEGLECESYLDTGNRGNFANADAPIKLKPDFSRTDHPAACLGLTIDVASVEPIWQRLSRRAVRLGFSIPVLLTTTDAQLHLLVSNVSLLRARKVLTGGLRFWLDGDSATPTRVKLISRQASPAYFRPWLDDRRQLGVCVSALKVWTLHDGLTPQTLPLDDNEILGQGWWETEHDGDATWRWTDGNATLTLPPGTVTLEVTIRATAVYLAVEEEKNPAHRVTSARSRL